MLFGKHFGFEVRKFKRSMGKNIIYKFSGECKPRANYFQKQRGDGV